MKKLFIVMMYFVLSLSLFVIIPLHAIQDKPALSWYEKAGKVGAKVVGAVGGGKVGAYLGSSLDQRLIEGYEDLDDEEKELQKEREELAQEEEELAQEKADLEEEWKEIEKEMGTGEELGTSESKQEEAVPPSPPPAVDFSAFERIDEALKLQSFESPELELEDKFTEEKIIQMLKQGAIGAIKPARKAGMLGGALAGYHLGAHAATRALAWRHGVSYRVEKISQFYDINTNQYGALLSAADKRDKEAIMKEMDTVFAQRFGPHWRQKIADCFKFDNYLFYLLNKRQKKNAEFTDQEKEDIRLIELGAALEDLYVGTTSSKENKRIIKSALAMYEFLDLVHRGT